MINGVFLSFLACWISSPPVSLWHHDQWTQADFTAQLEAAGNRLVVVDFYATWCGPCKIIAPKLEALATEYKDEIIVLKVDVDENEEVAAEYQIEAMPTFVFIKRNATVARLVGANEAKVREAILANK